MSRTIEPRIYGQKIEALSDSITRLISTESRRLGGLSDTEICMALHDVETYFLARSVMRFLHNQKLRDEIHEENVEGKTPRRTSGSSP